jgi:hypothetical protein
MIVRAPVVLPTSPRSDEERDLTALVALKTLRVLKSWDALAEDQQDRLRADLAGIRAAYIRVDLDELLRCPQSDRERMASVIVDALGDLITSAAKENSAVYQEALAAGAELAKHRWGVDAGRVVWPAGQA